MKGHALLALADEGARVLEGHMVAEEGRFSWAYILAVMTTLVVRPGPPVEMEEGRRPVPLPPFLHHVHGPALTGIAHEPKRISSKPPSQFSESNRAQPSAGQSS